jgi:capsular exopolysaccharide synthesis family protein
METRTNSLDEISFQKQASVYLNKWPWFVLSILIMLSISFAYLRYATEIYQAESSIMIKDTSSGGVSETWALGDLDVLGSSFNTVENEMEILGSQRLMQDVVRKLQLNISYYKEGRLKSADLYKESPVRLTILADSLTDPSEQFLNFQLRTVNSATFEIRETSDLAWSVHDFGSVLEYKNLSLLLTYIDDPNSLEILAFNEPITIVVIPVELAAAQFSSRLLLTKIDKRSSVIQLSISDSNIFKTEDILNTLVEVYNLDAIADKNAAAQNTAQFIDERLEEVVADLDSIEKGIQSFKNNKRLTDLAVESLIGLEASSGIGREVVMIQTQVRIANSLKEKLFTSNTDFLPSALGLEGADLNAVIDNYNTLLSEYLKLKPSVTALNPSIVNLEEELSKMRQAITISIDNYLNKLSLQQKSLERELNSVAGKISTVPENERLNRDIERTRRVVEAIYLLLSEKRETTAISLAITTPKAKIVDYARASSAPILPKKPIVLLACLVIGVLIPFSFIYLKTLFYNKIENRNDVEGILSNAAILGEIPRLVKGEADVIIENDRSILAESFRIVRTNLQYVISSTVSEETPVILVSSTIKGEGKTFVSYNIASTLAYTGKKVVLLGADIRNPQIHRYVERTMVKGNGLTEFIVNQALDVSDLIIKQERNKNLDLILSGKIPPNPAEILLSDRVGFLIEELKKAYDYVIIDSAPSILITDTFLINKYANVTAYVTRANFTDKSLIQYINEMIETKKLRNVAIVVNNVKVSNFGYGRRYAYDYISSKKSWFIRLKESLGIRK